MLTQAAFLQPSPLLRLVPWLVAGILLEDVQVIDGGIWLLALCVLLTFLLGRWPVAQSIGIGCCMLLLGMVVTNRHRSSLTFTETDGASIEAVVMSEMTEKPQTVAVDLLITENGRRVKAYLYKDERSKSLLPGDGLLLFSDIEPVDSLHVGSFHYGRYLLHHGFTGRCYVHRGDWQHHPVTWSRLAWTDRLRIRMLQWRHHLLLRYKALTDNEESASYALLAAMTLGDKTALTHEQREVFALTGTSHVLALSGLHMGILFSLISVLTFFGRRTLVAKLLLILLFWAFALLTGLSISVVRSALMLSIATIFSLREGHISSVNVLCFSALVILLFNPYALYDVGFQLSFLSVFAILLLMPLFDALWPPHFQNSHRCLQTLWRLVSVSMAAQIGTAPLVAFYFGQLPVYFVLSNLIVIPCSYVVLWLCLCYLVFPFPLIGQILLGTIKAMNNLLTALSGWPCASISGFHPSVLQTMMVYIIIIAFYLVIVKLRNIRVQL